MYYYRYPRGRTRLEPLALIIISVIMAVASVQVIVQSIEAIVTARAISSFDWISVGLMAFTVAVKLVLFLVCWRVGSDNPAVAVLAQVSFHKRENIVNNSPRIIETIVSATRWRLYAAISAKKIGFMRIQLVCA